MTAFENATKFFAACEAPEGWAGCEQFVAEGASFTAQSEPLVEVKTVEAYCEWMYGFATVTAPGATYELHASAYDEKTRTAISLRPIMPSIPEPVALCRRPTERPVPTTSTF